YAQASNSGLSPASLRTPPPGFTDIRYVAGRNDQEFHEELGPGFGSAADAPQPKRSARSEAAPRPAGPALNLLQVDGLSIVKPPYGVITAVNLDKGDIQWQVPYAETPDNVRNHPALKGLNIGNTG